MNAVNSPRFGSRVITETHHQDTSCSLREKDYVTFDEYITFHAHLRTIISNIEQLNIMSQIMASGLSARTAVDFKIICRVAN